MYSHACTASARLAPASSSTGCRQDRRQTLTVAAAPGCSAEGALEPAAGSLQRRQLLSAALLPPAAAALQALAPGVAAAAEAEAPAAAPAVAPSGATYYDEEDKFSIVVPAGWERGEGALGEASTLTSQQARFSNSAGLRRVVAFFPSGHPEVSVAVTVQFLGADYTKLGSFGSATDFATGVVTKMDNSFILKLPEWRRAKEGPVQVATVLDVREVDQGAKQYRFSYSLAKEGEPERTVYQAVAIGSTGRYTRLYTLNASCTAPDAAKYGPVLQQIVDSFTPPPPAMA